MSQLINLIRKSAPISRIKAHLKRNAHIEGYVNQQDNLGDTALLWATHKGKFSIVQLLIQHGADVNMSNIYGNTPLMYSVYQSIDFAQVFLMAGANENAANRTNDTPLIEAARVGFFEHVKLFLQFGADVLVRDNNGCTALDVAIKYHRYIDHHINLAKMPTAGLIMRRQKSREIIELLEGALLSEDSAVAC